MKVWLLYENYHDKCEYESGSYNFLCKIVDSEEKAKSWIFEKAIELCNSRIDQLELECKGNEYYDKGEPYVVPYAEDDPWLQNLKDEIYYFDCQKMSYRSGEKFYEVKDPNGYASWVFNYKEMEVE